MSEQLRIPLTVIAGCVYAGLIVLKILRIRRVRLPASRREERRESVRFDMIRLIADCAVMLGFLLSGLYPAWFGLFRNTPLGCCSGIVLLILATLLLSVFVDGFVRRKEFRQKGSTGDFLLRQLISILQIMFVLEIAWCSLLVLEPSETSLTERIAVAAGILLLVRVILYAARRIQGRTEE